jgi:RES domain
VIHDPALLERLGAFATERFDSEVFRATRKSLDPLAASTSGGRWAPRGLVPVLYTSLLREGALAEISYHWSQLTPWPSRPAVLHRLAVAAERRLRLLRADLGELDVDLAQYASINYRRTQEIGAAVAFLGCDGLIAPCARWNCENLVLFTENHSLTSKLEVLSSEEIDWQAWAQDGGFFNSSSRDESGGRFIGARNQTNRKDQPESMS